MFLGNISTVNEVDRSGADSLAVTIPVDLRLCRSLLSEPVIRRKGNTLSIVASDLPPELDPDNSNARNMLLKLQQ